MTEYVWDVYLPGEDLPHRLRTDYRLNDGEVLPLEGGWIVERVELAQADEHAGGRVYAIPAHEPS